MQPDCWFPINTELDSCALFDPLITISPVCGALDSVMNTNSSGFPSFCAIYASLGLNRSSKPLTVPSGVYVVVTPPT
ncbi:MAG: hypothetical protein EOM51_10830 [Clostridia bacterium]|nr:hypothetical protein [Clostridia bacterium]